MSDPVEPWMRDLSRHLHHLPDAAQDDILAEVRGAVRDRIEQGLTPRQALAGFGDAAAFARSFDSETSFDLAIARRQWRHALAALAEEAWRSVTIGFGLVAAAACILAGARIVMLAWQMSGHDVWIVPVSLVSLVLLAGGTRISARLAIARLTAARSL
jgi:hypothetical protein